MHPVGIASALAGMDRDVELPIADSKGGVAVLPVRQHPYKAEVVVAGIAHDVIEDVSLDVNGIISITKIPFAAIGRRSGDIKWDEFMKEYFRGKKMPMNLLRTL